MQQRHNSIGISFLRIPHILEDWEAGVKSLKCHWKRIVGKALLTFEEFSTLITQVEACLNSRSLIALFHEPNDPIWVQVIIFLLVLRWPPFLSQSLPIQSWTAYPDGSKFNASISSCGKCGRLATWTTCNNAANGAASNQTSSLEC